MLAIKERNYSRKFDPFLGDKSGAVDELERRIDTVCAR